MTVAQVFATHAEVFPGLPDGFAEFKRLVAGLSRTDALLWCCRINLHPKTVVTPTPSPAPMVISRPPIEPPRAQPH